RLRVATTTQTYTLSLHDALPIYIPELGRRRFVIAHELGHLLLGHGSDILKLCDEGDLLEWAKGQRPYENEANEFAAELLMPEDLDRKSTRLNSSHLVISYAVFCL